MKDKHLHVQADSLLLKQLHSEINQRLHIDPRSTAIQLTLKFIFYFFLMAVTYAVIFITHQPVVLVTAYILFGLFSVLLGFNFAHDFSHNTVFKSKSLNNFCFIGIYTLLGAHAEAWKYRHIHSHHYAPNVHDYDSDLQITSLIRVEPTGPYKWFHRFQHFYAPIAYTSYSLYWVLIKDFVIYFKEHDNPQKQKLAYHISFWSQKIIYFSYLLLFPILFSNFSWYWVALSFLVMHLLQSLFLLLTFFMTHHVEETEYFSVGEDGFIQASWLVNQIKSSNDFYPFSKTANFIFGGFNNHIAHHLFPHIHHVHYPDLNKILYGILKEHDIKPNVTSFTGGVVSHLRHLRNLSIRS